MHLLQQIKLSSSCRHGTSSARLAQQQFITVNVFVVALCLMLELFWPRSAEQRQPTPIKPTVYLTSECGYERRLGNTMFTLAATLGIANRNNMTPVIEYQTPLADAFKLHVARSRDMVNTMGGSSVEYFEYGRRGSAYDRATEHIFKAVGLVSHISLRGYFQSWRYFENVVDKVRDNFVFMDHVALEAESFLVEVAPMKWTHANDEFVRVGVHVRRGDMSEGYFKNYGYTTAPASYFLKAMRRFVEQYVRVQFIVCSDDIAWCKDNIPSPIDLGGGENIDVVFSSKRSQYVDLAILSRCDHVIMSVGSFGWWAAWLANGTTVYYADWPRPVSMLEYHVNKAEYFPPAWIPLR